MNQEIRVFTRQTRDIAITDIRGDVTAATGETIEDAYKQASADGVKKILLTFDEETYINIAFLI